MPDASFDAETTRLADSARAGDADAFCALVSLHERAARRVAMAALGNTADVDEAVQDACLGAWQQIAHLHDPSAFRAWLLRITWRKAIDRRRSLVRWLKRLRHEHEEQAPLLETIADQGITADEQFLAHERDRAIRRMIRSLPPRLRDPFLLAASGDHPYDEIAALLRIPVGTVKWRVAEARRVLREKLSRLGIK
jgi:RNA polymerase sigma-70 factor (ECF subfamily)